METVQQLAIEERKRNNINNSRREKMVHMTFGIENAAAINISRTEAPKKSSEQGGVRDLSSPEGGRYSKYSDTWKHPVSLSSEVRLDLERAVIVTICYETKALVRNVVVEPQLLLLIFLLNFYF
ncbi:hypothetical protein CEXT_758731 [Caerostris extrusa]|uniref:Uncharacterized protein n=1 Tax=Caerostris extrusa TaxID=172846 RepID=A0AAV4X3J9_CAEEX|nr:hypothetical protein CEXT_758731 [Caerostris extrusa]